MKTIVIYKSATGFTKKYAQWIQEALQCDIKDINDVKKQDYQKYDRVIYGSSLMAGKIKSLSQIKKNVQKELIVFGVGVMSQEDSIKVIDRIKNDNLTTQEQAHIPLFYFEGGLDYEKLGFVQRKILKTIYKSLVKKENKGDEELGMMKALESSSDLTCQDYIIPLIEICKKES